MSCSSIRRFLSETGFIPRHSALQWILGTSQLCQYMMFCHCFVLSVCLDVNAEDALIFYVMLGSPGLGI